jgi:hypothetical protein
MPSTGFAFMATLQNPAPPPQAAAPQIAPAIEQVVQGLRGEEAALNTQMSILLAQQQVLRTQTRSGGQAMRNAAANRMTDINMQIASTQVQLLHVRSELDAQGIAAAPATAVAATVADQAPPPFFPPPSTHFLDSDQVTAITIVFILAVLMPISIGLLRRMWRGSSKPSTQSVADVISPRLDHLEHATDAIALEIERISEGQRFVTKVLAERPVNAPAPSPGHQAPATARGGEVGAAGEGKSFRALGAGPIEPIRVAERQAVRQSITPH